MKVYSIGRGQDCDIVIADNSDVVSRRHAILTVYPTGKMCITDQSTNGTYVNGIKISPNVPVPVTRKDSVSFAHVTKLDWRAVPKATPVWVWAFIAIASTAILSFGAIKITESFKDRQTGGGKVDINLAQPKDTIEKVQKDTIVIRDTVNITKSIEDENSQRGAVKKKGGKDNEDPNPKEKSDSSVQSRRAIG